MLRKLYKHEFYSLFRNMSAIYIGLIVTALLCKLSWMMKEDSIIGSIARGSATVAYVLGVIAMFVVGVVIVIVRFYKNLLSKEAYLTHTLPFKTYQHLNCKLICGAAVILVNILVLLLSLIIFFLTTDTFKEFLRTVDELFFMLDAMYEPWQIAIMITEMVILVIVAIFNFLLMPYAAMSIGQRFKNKIGGSVVSYLCLYVAVEIIDTVIMVIVVLISGFDVVEIGVHNGFKIFSVSLVLAMLYTGAITLAMYLISRSQLTKHLNLE